MQEEARFFHSCVRKILRGWLFVVVQTYAMVPRTDTAGAKGCSTGRAKVRARSSIEAPCESEGGGLGKVRASA